MKVLIADDEAVTLRMLEATLRRWGYQVVTARDGLEALRILREPDAPKLVVIDWLMPGLDGVELCHEIRSRGSEPYTYILLITGRRGQEDVVVGLSAGADDYIGKPFDPQELRVRLRAGKRILCLQDQLIAAREALRDKALHDSLTGVWNHAAILDMLSKEIVRAQRDGASLGFLLADLDHFKSVNDTFGHPVGDCVLREAAHVLRESTRLYDAVGRVGGEEFAIILSGCDQINAISHAERLRAALEATEVATSNGPVRITASFGVTVWHDGAGIDSGDLVQAADTALYQAKEAGRNCVRYMATNQSVLLPVH